MISDFNGWTIRDHELVDVHGGDVIRDAVVSWIRADFAGVACFIVPVVGMHPWQHRCYAGIRLRLEPGLVLADTLAGPTVVLATCTLH